MKKLIAAIATVLVACTCTIAAERKLITEIDSAEFTKDTQVMVPGAGDNHVAIAWWIPYEFWAVSLSKNRTTSPQDKKAILDTLSGISIISVVQADVSAVGAFRFYTKEEIEDSLRLSFIDAAGGRHRLAPMKKLNPDLEVVLAVIKPILSAAMGNLGSNMHFYVLNDLTKSSRRLIDPYSPGRLDIGLSRKDSGAMTAVLEMPLNSLYVPRKCPNGKEAHISWKYCPWSGERLKD